MEDLKKKLVQLFKSAQLGVGIMIGVAIGQIIQGEVVFGAVFGGIVIGGIAIVIGRMVRER